MSLQLAVIWAISFIVAAIPLHRLIPLGSRWIQDQAATLDRPRFKAHHVMAVRSVGGVVVLTVLKGAMAGWLLNAYCRADWTALVMVAVVVIAHSWSIFSDAESPSTFWIWIGLWAVLSPGLILVFVAVTALAAVVLNVGVLAVCVGVAVSVYGAVSMAILPPSAPVVLAGIVAVLGGQDLLRFGSDFGDSPTFFGAFRRRP